MDAVEDRRLLRRVLTALVMLPVSAALSLTLFDRLRSIWRTRRTPDLPVVAPREVAVGDTNQVTVHVHGAPLYDAMLDAIAGARRRILLESYIIKGDAMGQRFKDALMAAADRGVAVYVIYDGFANLVVRPSFFDFGSRVQVQRFPMLARWRAWNPRSWGRDHRKILVVDDTIGFVGGYNIGADYASRWRDTHVSLVGPAVWELENTFVDFWNNLPSTPRLEPLLGSSWEPRIRGHRNVPNQLIFPIRAMYLEAIDRAERRIEITQAYFVPDRSILDALVEAARRGVDVRILIPRVSNHVVADFISRSTFTRLLEAGVTILRYRDHMVHAKTMTIDGQWSTVGTANIDRLSLSGNYEVNLEILDPPFAEAMHEVFARDSELADALDLDRWRDRSWLGRFYEHVLQPWWPVV